MSEPSTWADTGMLSFDTETTGVDTEHDRIVTAATIYVQPGQPPVTREWLADPGIPIPDTAAAIHGITTAHARAHGAPLLDVVNEVIGDILGYLTAGVPLVVYNAPYDLTLLDRCARRAGIPTLDDSLTDLQVPLYVIDPLAIDRGLDPGRRGKGVRKLTYLCQHVYGVPLADQDAHGAAADALASARLAWKMTRRYPHLGRTPLDELQIRQQAWHQAWSREFGLYLRRSGRVDDTDFNWPWRAPAELPLFDQAPTAPQGERL